jgi:hypothetical protein
MDRETLTVEFRAHEAVRDSLSEQLALARAEGNEVRASELSALIRARHTRMIEVGGRIAHAKKRL